MEFVSVDLNKYLELCIEFRRDTHILSYGTDKTFDRNQCIDWFNQLKESNNKGFVHIIINEKIVGQLEFKSAIEAAEGNLSGYINLLYLIPEYRGKGYGLKLQNYIFSKFHADGCSLAYLRYLPENNKAGLFYLKNGWSILGEPNARGQLMVHYFNSPDID